MARLEELERKNAELHDALKKTADQALSAKLQAQLWSMGLNGGLRKVQQLESILDRIAHGRGDLPCLDMCPGERSCIVAERQTKCVSCRAGEAIRALHAALQAVRDESEELKMHNLVLKEQQQASYEMAEHWRLRVENKGTDPTP